MMRKITALFLQLARPFSALQISWQFQHVAGRIFFLVSASLFAARNAIPTIKIGIAKPNPINNQGIGFFSTVF